MIVVYLYKFLNYMVFYIYKFINIKVRSSLWRLPQLHRVVSGKRLAFIRLCICSLAR